MQIVFILFLWTATIGMVLFVIAWLATRRLAGYSRLRRAMLAGITAFAVAPSILDICGQPCIVPAFTVSLFVLAPDALRRSLGLAFGILPFATVAALLFCVGCWRAETKPIEPHESTRRQNDDDKPQQNHP